MVNKPQKIRCGSVEAAIWQNTIKIEGRDVPCYSVQIQRRYKDNDGNWKDTSSFPLSDLPRVALVAQKSFEQLTIKQNLDGVQQPKPEAII